MRMLAIAALACALHAQTKLPPYTRQTLPNGVVIGLLPRKDVPLLTLRVLVKGGAESDPAGAAGLANVTAELLRRGTASRSAERFADEIDALGAQFNTRVDAQSTAIQAEFLSKVAPAALDLVADAVLRPAFSAGEVKKTLAEHADAVRALKDQPGPAATLYFRSFFFGTGHPYAHPSSGDETSLARITREQIAAYHQRMYVGGNLIVIAAGDFDAAALSAMLAKAFGAAPAGGAYRWRAEQQPARASEPRLLLVNKPGATQTYFNIGHTGIRRTDPDRVVVRVVNTLFGGRFTSMLNDELRVNSGLTYGAGSSFDQDRLTGAFRISSYTPAATTAKAIDLTLGVLNRLREKGINAEQLASAKAYIKGTFPTDRLETSGQLAAAIGELELFGLGREDVDEFLANVDAVTVEQANAAIRRRFGSESLTFVLVGDAPKIREALKKYARDVAETEISKPGFGN
ncbi:MAG: M16 family metallopeptidase [Bryobacteraceae bacterium]